MSRTWLRKLAARVYNAARIPGSVARGLGWRRRHPVAGGVSLLGYIRAETGMGEAARSSARALHAAGIPFDIYALDTGTDALQRDRNWEHREVPVPGHRNLLLNVNADSTTRVLRRLKRSMQRGRFIIAHWTWELPEFPDMWLPVFDHVDEVWAPSRFVQAAIAAKSPVPVIRIPYCVRIDDVAPRGRAHFNLPEDRFLFLTMFDPMSYMPRKNPEAALAAFERAFAGAAGAAGLVIKVNRPRGALPPGFRGSQVQDLLERARALPGVHVIDSVLERREMNALMALCNCFVSLHRSEGFGLGGAESFASGRPVIQTAWSGNVDYMDADAPGSIRYKLVPLGEDIGPYAADQVWAEPDVDDAARWMQVLAADPAFAARVGEEGRRRIEAEFSPVAVGALLAARLREP